MFCFDVLYQRLCDEMLCDPLDHRDFGSGAGTGLPASALAPDLRDPSQRWADLDPDRSSP